MTPRDLVAAVFAFLLGLLAKFVYDLWSESRKKKYLEFTKTIQSSFSINKIAEDLRKQIQVLYEGQAINSIHLVRVDVENTSLSAISNQTFTVRFSELAHIIGDPQSDSSSEDLRFVEADTETDAPNLRRFIIRRILKGRRLSWVFAVVNHDETKKIEVEHGTLEEASGEDLNVEPTEKEEKAQLDLEERLRRIVTFLILVPIVVLLRNALSAVPGSEPLLVPFFSGLLTVVWLILLSLIIGTISPLMNWLRGLRASGEYVGGDLISIGNITTSRGVAIGEAASAQLLQLDEEVLRRLLVNTIDVVADSPDPPSLPPSDS